MPASGRGSASAVGFRSSGQLSDHGFRTIQAFPKDLPVPSGATSARGKLASAGSEGEPMPDVRRRELIALLGGAAAAWPLAARAQQPGKLPTIGYLGQSTLAAESQLLAAFVQRLGELGWVEGRTVAIELRWGEGRNERFAEFATEFVRLNVEVIVASGTANIVAAKQATSVIPIVFAAVGNPIGSGLVASLARPGGNLTGLSTQAVDLTGKRLEFLREVIPGPGRLAIMGNVGNPSIVLEMGELKAAARTLGFVDRSPRNSQNRGYRARLRVTQGARRRTVCRFRCARIRQLESHQHVGVGRAAADDVRQSGARRSGGSYVLRTEQPRAISARRRLCRQDSARGEAGRSPGRATDQVRSDHQPSHCQGPWAYHPPYPACPRRRGDRIAMPHRPVSGNRDMSRHGPRAEFGPTRASRSSASYCDITTSTPRTAPADRQVISRLRSPPNAAQSRC